MVLEYLRQLVQQGIYTLAEVRAMVTGIPLEEHWISLPDGRYVELNEAMRRWDMVVSDEDGDIVNVLPDDGTHLEAQFEPQEGAEIERHDIVAVDPDGRIRRATVNDETPVGIALEPIREGGVGRVRMLMHPNQMASMMVPDWSRSASFAYAHMGSHAYSASTVYDDFLFPMTEEERHRARERAFTNEARLHAAQDQIGVTQRQNTYQYTQKAEAEKKAWKLLEQYMTPEQYFAFMEGTTVELINKAESHRLLINKKGDFNILQGIKAGSGISESEGTIRSYEYPLGDQISAFLDWFRHRTPELIANWNCGTYSIVKEGERR